MARHDRERPSQCWLGLVFVWSGSRDSNPGPLRAEHCLRYSVGRTGSVGVMLSPNRAMERSANARARPRFTSAAIAVSRSR